MALGGGSVAAGAGAIRGGRAFVELFLKDNVSGGLGALQKRLAAAGKFLAVGGAAGAAAGTAVVTPLLAAGKAALDRNTQIAGLAAKLSVTTEDLSALAYAAEQTGNSFEDLQGHFENFAERIGQAAQGTGEASATFQKLGLDATRLARIPITQAMEETLVAISKVSSATEQLAMLSSLGGDQFQKLAVLARMGGDGMAALRAEALLVGAVLSSEDAAKAVAVQRSFNGVYAAGASVVRELGMAVLPSAEAAGKFRDMFARSAAQVREFIDANRETIQVVAVVGAGLIAGGTALAALGAAAGAASLGVGVIGSGLAAAGAAVGSLATPAGAAAVAVAGLGAAFLTMTDSGKAAASAVGAYLGDMATNAKATFVGMGDALKSGDLRAAAQIAMKGVEVEWKRATVAVLEVWNAFNDTVADAFRDGMDAVELAWNDFTAAVDSGLSDLENLFWDNFGAIAEVGQATWEEVKRHAGDAAQWATEQWEAFSDTITNAWEKVAEAVGDAFDAVAEKFSAVFGPVGNFIDKHKDLLKYAGMATNPLALAVGGTAAVNQALEDATGANQTDYAAKAEADRAAIERKRLADEQAIQDRQAKDREAGRAGRAGDLTDAKAELAKAEAAAREAQVVARWKSLMLPKGAEAALRAAVPDAAQIGKMARGAFAVGNAQQLFGGDNQPVLSEMKRQTKMLEELALIRQAIERDKAFIVVPPSPRGPDRDTAPRFT